MCVAFENFRAHLLAVSPSVQRGKARTTMWGVGWCGATQQMADVRGIEVVFSGGGCLWASSTGADGCNLDIVLSVYS